MTRSLFTPLLCVSALALTACWPEDRSGEQPFAPTVKTVSAVPTDSFCSLEGQVLLSPNSRVLERGFRYGNDTLLVDTLSSDSSDFFTGKTGALQPGRYYVVAYARNGIGLSLGDTLYFDIL